MLSIFQGINDWHGLDSTDKKTHPQVTTDQQTYMTMRNVEKLLHTQLSL